MGTAFVAVADDPSAIAVNPAGLTQMTGTNIYGGDTLVVPSSIFKSPEGREEDTDFQIFYPPHLFVTSDPGTGDLRVGLGIFSPFGIGGRKWSDTGLTRYLSTESAIATLCINPTMAYRITPALSVGFGLEYMLSKTEAKRRVNQSVVGAADGEIELNALGDGWGYNLGILFTPQEQLSLGFAYRSRIKVEHHGDIRLKNIAPALQTFFGGSEFETDVETPAEFPDIVSLGLAYRPDKRLTLAFDAELVRWSSFRRAELDLEKEVPQAGFTDSSTNLDWKDSWLIKLGLEYRMTDRFFLRNGYAYVESPVPDHTLDPGNPESDQHNFSAGFGYKTERMTIDFFYMAGFYEKRTVKNDILSGTYENTVHYAGVSVGYKF
jgi:long-chain fatty acid transport protein